MPKDATSPLEDKDQLLALEKLGTPVTFPAGRVIFTEGHPSHTVLLIKEGHVIVVEEFTAALPELPDEDGFGNRAPATSGRPVRGNEDCSSRRFV